MKKGIAIVLAAVMAVSLLAGCSASYDMAKNARPEEDGYYYQDAKSEESAAEAPEAETGFIASSTADKPTDFAEKIIYSADATVETTQFDQAVENLYFFLDFYKGFIESSYVSGRGYEAEFHGNVYRRAEFTVRVPVGSFEGFKSALANVGKVTGISTYGENITTQYYDVQSRLTAYQTEEKTLLSMMEKAETVSDMIEIENALSEVRYNIESLQTTLKNWDNRVDYSTVTVNIHEVRELSRVQETPKSYWEEIADGFRYSLESVGRFFKNVFSWFVSNLPVIVLVIAIAAAVIAIIRKAVSRNPERAARRLAKKEAKAAKKAEKTAKKAARTAIKEDVAEPVPEEKKDDEV